MPMIRILIRKDYIGNLAFSFFTTGIMINEQWVFPPAQRIALKEGEIAKEPTFTISNITANEFMLALKEAIREYEGNTPDFSQGELKATKYHLEDMRQLLTKLLGTGEGN